MQSVGRHITRLIVSSIIRLWASLTLLVRRSRKKKIIDTDPTRILLMNCAHIGDVVISTSLLPVLRSAYPQAEIGFLTGSWSSMVVRDHPDIAFTHQIDHWRLNRTKIPLRMKVLRSWRTRRIALREIRSLNYDMSLSLHSWFPDFLYLAWQAGIPSRLGFTHSLFAPFATMLSELPQADFIHQGDRIAEILSPLRIDAAHLSKRHSILGLSTAAAKQEVCALLGVETLERASYIVIHVGSERPPERCRRNSGVWLQQKSRLDTCCSSQEGAAGKDSRLPA